MNKIANILKILPIWYGVFFIGPLLAEVTLRTSIFTPVLDYLANALPLSLVSTIETMPVYGICMTIGGVYGLVAQITGRWI
ncbi:MAG: hypothetical protein ACON33_09305 [Candidatus Micropelagos thuwalensis]